MKAAQMAVLKGVLAWLALASPIASAGPVEAMQPEAYLPIAMVSGDRGCREWVGNGSFEHGMVGWAVDGKGSVKTRARDPWVRPYDGDFVAEVRPQTADYLWEGLELYNALGPGISTEVIRSATLRYAYQGHTTSTMWYGDWLAIELSDPSCWPCRSGIEQLFNHDVTGEWVYREVDVGDVAGSDWSDIRLVFRAVSRFSGSTWWYVDAVSLEVCTR